MSFVDLDRKQQPDAGLVLRWSAKAATYVCTSFVDDAVVVVGDTAGNLRAFAKASGKPIWKTKTASAVLEPMFGFDGLLWLFDSQGAVVGLDAATGAERVRHGFAQGGWSARRVGGSIVFLQQQSRNRGERGLLASLDLASGRLACHGDAGTSSASRRNERLAVSGDGSRIATLLFPFLSIFDWPSGEQVARHALPPDEDSTGLIGFGASFATVSGRTERCPGLKESLLIASVCGLARFELPLPALPSLGQQGSALPLGPDRTLLEYAELLIEASPDAMLRAVPLPARSPSGRNGKGLVSIGGRPHVFQASEEAESSDDENGHFLQLYAVDPASLVASAVGRPMKTHPRGRNFKAASVDVFGTDFLVRGDGRFHLLTAATS